MGKWYFGVIAVSVPMFKLEQPARGRGDCEVDRNCLTDEPAFLNFVADRSISVNLDHAIFHLGQFAIQVLVCPAYVNDFCSDFIPTSGTNFILFIDD